MRYCILLITLSITLVSSEIIKLGNLEWQNNSEAKTIKLNWQDAKSYCQELSLSNYSDWRLPNIKELQSITDISKRKPAIKKEFTNISPSIYWSLSENVSNTKYAWYIHFIHGGVSNRDKNNKSLVRCVRTR